ncbi:MAG: hypothetical protein WKG07_03670 [Hymenobacter sp.]
MQLQTGHKKEARNTYLKALNYDKSKFQIWQQVVLLDAELNQTDSLLVHSDRALELFPNQAPLWFYNGLGHLLKKQPQQAAQCPGARPPPGRRATWSSRASSIRSSAMPTRN